MGSLAETIFGPRWFTSCFVCSKRALRFFLDDIFVALFLVATLQEREGKRRKRRAAAIALPTIIRKSPLKPNILHLEVNHLTHDHGATEHPEKCQTEHESACRIGKQKLDIFRIDKIHGRCNEDERGANDDGR